MYKFLIIHQKSLESINEFSKFAQFKINMLISLHTNNEISKSEINTMPFIIALKRT
jgi:hypothetical protein